MRVSLSNSDRCFSVSPDQSLLESAQGAGLALPHGCKGGNCGACRARLLKGDVHYPQGPPLGLSEAESAAGMILLCQARACSDLVLETFEVMRAGEAVIKRLPCRIERTQGLSHDVLAVFLRLPAAESFDFAAGQYLDVLLPGGRRRSFSIASPPHAARPLELHVRRVEDGEFTAPLFTGEPRGRLLEIHGPLGAFTLRPSSAPLLFVGGGTGLAPLQSMLLDLLQRDRTREIRLYWGVRAERDLYAHASLSELLRRAPGLDYRPVLSEPGADWRGRRGWVHAAVLEDWPRLDGFDVYASGPPAMIEAVRREFPRHGADAARLFFDSFDYAPDSQARQRIKADTRS